MVWRGAEGQEQQLTESRWPDPGEGLESGPRILAKTYPQGRAMAGSVNKVILVGNLGRDPEVRTFQNGGKVCNLSIATSENWRDKRCRSAPVSDRGPGRRTSRGSGRADAR